MNYEFRSAFAEDICAFITEKHALGYPYLDSERVLHYFDKFCLDQFSESNTLSKEIGIAWAVIKPTEKPASFQNRLAPVRELAKYMKRNGKNAYVIPTSLAPKSGQQYQPHIFTQNELQAFFHQADSYKFESRSHLRHLQIPIYFRFLYCCGLRPNEARLIRYENLKLNDRVLLIPESKGHKDRLIVIPEELCMMLEKYAFYLKNEFPSSDYLFPCQRFKGAAYHKGWPTMIFHECWNSCHFETTAGNNPRPYDFRHTFATYRIYEWMKQEKDLMSMLPYLSAYMGHSHISHTAYYIHLVPEFFAEMSGMDMNLYSSLIPEVPYE